MKPPSCTRTALPFPLQTAPHYSGRTTGLTGLQAHQPGSPGAQQSTPLT